MLLVVGGKLLLWGYRVDKGRRLLGRVFRDRCRFVGGEQCFGRRVIGSFLAPFKAFVWKTSILNGELCFERRVVPVSEVGRVWWRVCNAVGGKKSWWAYVSKGRLGPFEEG